MIFRKQLTFNNQIVEMKHIIISGLFFLFSAFQYNDPDFYIWIPIYQIVGVLILLYYKKVYHPRIFQVALIAYILGMLSYYPDVINWIKEGTPSITGSMQAESPFIEFIREFFGLGICAIALGYYTYLAQKAPK